MQALIQFAMVDFKSFFLFCFLDDASQSVQSIFFSQFGLFCFFLTDKSILLS